VSNFNPTEHKPGESDADSKYLTIAGDFILAFTRYSGRQTNANGKEFLKLSGVVIAGEPSSVIGKLFSQRVYLTPESHARLGAMCAAMQWAEPFDLDSDADVKRVLLNRPFKAKVKVESRDGRNFAGIAFFEHRLTTQERDAMNEWVANGALGMDDDVPPPESDIPF
jgi:hypothetical protein